MREKKGVPYLPGFFKMQKVYILNDWVAIRVVQFLKKYISLYKYWFLPKQIYNHQLWWRTVFLSATVFKMSSYKSISNLSEEIIVI